MLSSCWQFEDFFFFLAANIMFRTRSNFCELQMDRSQSDQLSSVANSCFSFSETGVAGNVATPVVLTVTSFFLLYDGGFKAPATTHAFTAFTCTGAGVAFSISQTKIILA